MPPCIRLVIRHEAELGEWWAEKAWAAVPWVFRSDHPRNPRPFSLFGVEIVFKDVSYSYRMSPGAERGWQRWRRCTAC